jgi:phage-related minor tail protein
MKRSRRNEQRTPPALAATGWSAASFRISTADGWLEVDGIVRSPFGIDQRATDETGDRSWFVTHLPSGLAVVSQVRALAVVLALVDQIAALTDWDAQNIRATPELREPVREALNRAYGDFFAHPAAGVPGGRSARRV